MAEIKDLLDREIEERLQNLSKFETRSEEKSKAIDEISRLHRLRIEEIKTEAEVNEKREKMDEEMSKNVREANFRCDQLEESRKDRIFRLGVAAAELILPMIFYAVWMHKGFKFEEEGTYTSTTFKGLFNRFRPTK